MFALFASTAIACTDAEIDPDVDIEALESEEPDDLAQAPPHGEARGVCDAWQSGKAEVTMTLPIEEGRVDQWRGPGDRLPLVLTNGSTRRREVTLRGRLNAIGSSVEKTLLHVELAPNETITVPLRPADLHPARSLERTSLGLSAQLELHLDEVESDGTSQVLGAQEVWLHAERGELLAYSYIGLADHSGGNVGGAIPATVEARIIAKHSRGPDAIVPIVVQVRQPGEVRHEAN